MIQIYNENFTPKEFKKLKEEHYKDIFEKNWHGLYNNNFDDNEQTIIATYKGKPAGRTVLQLNKYDVRMRDFTVLKEYRSKGVAKELMKGIEEITNHYHNQLMNSGKKYDMMFLRTYIYPKRTPYDFTTLPYDEKFQMSHFLEKQGFKDYKYNPKALSKEENLALKIYKENYPEFLPTLRVFKKTIVNNLELKPEIKEELKKINKHQKDIVLKGLDVKLAVYDKRGFVSYKYSVCPVCSDLNSSLENNSNCKLCYIENACLEPFNEGFKEDNEVSQAYFSKMRDYLRK